MHSFKGRESQQCGFLTRLGIIGSRADAEQIRQEVRQFIEHDLRLSIAEEKSHISHSKKGVTFVGYELKTYSADRVIKLKRGTRHTWVKSLSEQIQLHIPQDKMQKFCTQRGYGVNAMMIAGHPLPGKVSHFPETSAMLERNVEHSGGKERCIRCHFEMKFVPGS